jgi:hypothetical protein
MKPVKPHHVHSGTGEGATPADKRGPASPASGVRNPDPVTPVTAGRPLPSDPIPQDDNPATNGYWLRDDVGPRSYVAPLVNAPKESEDDPVRQIAEALELQLGTLPDWPDQTIHVRRLEGELRLVGFVTSEVMRRAAERCAEGATAEACRNDLVVR